MRHLMEALECRRLLSGGVDATFGSASGASVTAPGNAPRVMDSAVDGAGRVVLAGWSFATADGSQQTRMLVTRLNGAGEPDGKFGVGGVVQGTVRGLHKANLITPLPGGGYLVSGDTEEFQASARLVKFGPRGTVDTTFGDRGVAHINLTPQRVLELPDGDILIVGFGPSPNPAEVGLVNLLERLNPDGRIDPSFGAGGFVEVNTADTADDFVALSSRIYSASVDDQGRILIAAYAFSSTTVGGMPAGRSEQVFLQRFLADGTRDPTFGNDDNDNRAVLFDKSWSAEDLNPPAQQIALAAARHDGQIVALRQDDPGSLDVTDVPPGTLTLLDATGTPTSTAANLAIVAPGFTVSAFPNFNKLSAGDRLMHVLDDDSILLAGMKTSGSTHTPAVARLKSDLTLDTSFGTGGFLTLSTIGGVIEASDMSANRDGTMTVLSTVGPPSSEIDQSASGARVTRIFVDDRPVVTLTRVRTVADQIRVRVLIRGVHPIDTTSLDDNDLRLIDSLGGRRKLRLVDFVDAGGAMSATYRLNRGLLAPGAAAVVAIGGQVLDDHSDGCLAGELGTFAV